MIASLLLALFAAHAQAEPVRTIAQATGRQFCECWEQTGTDRPNINRGLVQFNGTSSQAESACRRKLGRPAFSSGCFASVAEYKAILRDAAKNGSTSEVVFRWWKNGSSQVPGCVQGYDRDGRYVDTCTKANARGKRRGR